mgnify:CR=1 FL=1
MSNMVKIIEAVNAINPSAKLTFRGDDVDTGTFEWLEGTAPISKDDIKAKMIALEYKSKRKNEYPTIEELVVALYDTDDKSAIEAKRAEVKARFPKNE